MLREDLNEGLLFKKNGSDFVCGVYYVIKEHNMH